MRASRGPRWEVDLRSPDARPRGAPPRAEGTIAGLLKRSPGCEVANAPHQLGEGLAHELSHAPDLYEVCRQTLHLPQSPRGDEDLFEDLEPLEALTGADGDAAQRVACQTISMPVSACKRAPSPWSSAPPPVSTIPVSMMWAASSGGGLSSAMRPVLCRSSAGPRAQQRLRGERGLQPSAQEAPEGPTGMATQPRDDGTRRCGIACPSARRPQSRGGHPTVAWSEAATQDTLRCLGWLRQTLVRFRLPNMALGHEMVRSMRAS